MKPQVLKRCHYWDHITEEKHINGCGRGFWGLWIHVHLIHKKLFTLPHLFSHHFMYPPLSFYLFTHELSIYSSSSFPKQVYLWGSILEKNRLDTLVGALGLVGRGFGPAGRAGLGWAWGLAVLGALACGVGRAGRAGWVGRGVGRGVWPCWARWLGWAWCWACWARWLGVVLGVGFGRAGRAGLGWAWGLAMLGALAGLGVVFKVEK